MLTLRLVVLGTIVLLALAPCLGFASGQGPLPLTKSHSSGTAHFAWKTTPGTMAPSPPRLVLASAKGVPADAAALTPSRVLPLPFVPPRY